MGNDLEIAIFVCRLEIVYKIIYCLFQNAISVYLITDTTRLAQWLQEVLAQVAFCPRLNSVYIWSTIYVYTNQSIRNRYWNTLTHWKKICRDVTASHRASVIIQQYSSTSMRFHSPKEKLGARFRIVMHVQSHRTVSWDTIHNAPSVLDQNFHSGNICILCVCVW
jgi:hypothetical protein